MTDYDFRQHIGEWVETRRGIRVKVIGYNSEADEGHQLVIQYPAGDTSVRSVNGTCTPYSDSSLVPPAREYTTRVKLFRWSSSSPLAAIEENRWGVFEKYEGGDWVSEPTEVTLKLLPGVKLP